MFIGGLGVMEVWWGSWLVVVELLSCSETKLGCVVLRSFAKLHTTRYIPKYQPCIYITEFLFMIRI